MNGIDNERATDLNTPVTVLVVTVDGERSVEKTMQFAPLRFVSPNVITKS